ncbi:MAG TPA: SDR family NAD(P)-dependent oxidoreductase [Acidimicrobiales bacterium]|nr:SDR family NAD(P)-dependent oxidoreductase [Acidimicrobiales bacterium]
MEELNGKTVVITGAASGIGRSMAAAFAREGARLVLGDIEPGPLHEVVASHRGGGTEAVGVVTDVAKWDDVVALRDAALDAFGAVHVICNNAGVGGGGQLWEIELDDWHWVVGVDLWGVIHGVKAFVPLLVEQGEGHVVNTASVAGLTSPPFMGPYNVSKHGVVTLTETLSAELAMVAPGVGASVVCPGWVKTRIDESSRNRPGGPAAPGDPDAEVENATRDAIAGFIANGISPDLVASAAVDAVRTGRFYVLTHPDMNQGIADRVERIVSGRPPASAMELFGAG